MNRSFSISISVLSLLLTSAPYASAQTGERTLQGSIDGAPYTIKLPATWNGTLLVYEDGYRDVADAPGEVEDRIAYPAPPEIEQELLSRGYGLAGSAFRVNGYNIQEGIEDTQALIRFFRRQIGTPRRTILFGTSGGPVRAAEILETDDRLVDGAISFCGVMAGTPLFFDRALDFAVAYAAAFGWPAAWGSPGNVRDDLDFEGDVVPVFMPQLSDPANFGRFEFIRLVNGLPLDGFYDGPAMLFLNMFFTTKARAQLERKLSGPATQNVDHTYRLSSADEAYLASRGVDAPALLREMNAHTNYAAQRSARKYVEKFASFNGKIRKPLLSMHAIFDGLVTVDHEWVYDMINREAGRQKFLSQVYTNGVGHCTFTPEQQLSTIDAMKSWLDTGNKPGLAFFPSSLGFDHAFKPPKWPYPIEDEN
jgi:hypothetical protein